MKKNNYKGYSLFNDVDNVSLRTWNRCVTAANINNTMGEVHSKNYLSHFSELEKKRCMAMYQYILVIGSEEVRKQILKGDIDKLVNKAKGAMN